MLTVLLRECGKKDEQFVHHYLLVMLFVLEASKNIKKSLGTTDRVCDTGTRGKYLRSYGSFTGFVFPIRVEECAHKMCPENPTLVTAGYELDFCNVIR